MEHIMKDAWEDPSIWTEPSVREAMREAILPLLERDESIRGVIRKLLTRDVSMYLAMAKNSTVRAGMLESASHHMVSMVVVQGLLTHASLPGDRAALNEMLQLSRIPCHFQRLSLVLRDPRFAAGIDWNLAFQTAARRGWLAAVHQYLTDFGVDPAADNNRAIILAAGRGDGDRPDKVKSGACHQTSSVIRLLLTYVCVDPSVDNNRALFLAASHGLDDNVDALLTDTRVCSGNIGQALVASVVYPDILRQLLHLAPPLDDRRAALDAARAQYQPPVPDSIGLLEKSLVPPSEPHVKHRSGK
jgi:hypothetical protein